MQSLEQHARHEFQCENPTSYFGPFDNHKMLVDLIFVCATQHPSSSGGWNIRKYMPQQKDFDKLKPKVIVPDYSYFFNLTPNPKDNIIYFEKVNRIKPSSMFEDQIFN